jgi:hypothetical protein
MKTRLGIGCLLAVLTLLVGLSVLPSSAERMVECIDNPDFEVELWVGADGKHGVAQGWKSFDNGGAMTASFHPDTWVPVVYNGKYSQLIEINTFCHGASDPNRYAGIYQWIWVPKGTTCELCMHGLLRSLPGDPDPASWGYIVQVGIDHQWGNDWSALTVEDWTDVPWDTVHPKSAPPGIDPDLTPDEKMDSFCMDFTSESDFITIFIRLWKKWATNNREVLLNLDAVSVMCPMH